MLSFSSVSLSLAGDLRIPMHQLVHLKHLNIRWKNNEHMDAWTDGHRWKDGSKLRKGRCRKLDQSNYSNFCLFVHSSFSQLQALCPDSLGTRFPIGLHVITTEATVKRNKSSTELSEGQLNHFPLPTPIALGEGQRSK